MRGSPKPQLAAEKIAELDEMRRLYEEERLSLRAIGRLFGMTRQGVYNRFVAAGIPRRQQNTEGLIEFAEKRRERANELLIAHREDILRMYVDERLSLASIAKRFGISGKRIRDHLVECGVEIRPSGNLPKYPELGRLKAGESILLPRAARKRRPHFTFYRMAKSFKMRISLESIDERTFRVTRIE